MQKVDDPVVDMRIRKKVVGFVSFGAVASVFVIGAFCFWPL
jgi:hypothetical protein